MAVTSVRTISLLGLAGTLVDIEVDISDGLPIYTLLGLPDTALMESISSTLTSIIEYETDSAITTSNKRSRLAGVNSLESRISLSESDCGSFKITEAITNGPAHGPRPASSTPAILVIPAASKEVRIK